MERIRRIRSAHGVRFLAQRAGKSMNHRCPSVSSVVSKGRGAKSRTGARRIMASLLVFAGCQRAERPAMLFELLSPKATGVTFANELPEAPDFNILNYLYYYNGGGVAVGDIDADGLPDLYFSSNLGPNRLFRNKGNYAFEDVTERSGVAAPGGWKTGVTMADVNGDGHVDIYVSAV